VSKEIHWSDSSRLLLCSGSLVQSTPATEPRCIKVTSLPLYKHPRCLNLKMVVVAFMTRMKFLIKTEAWAVTDVLCFRCNPSIGRCLSPSARHSRP
ncbi:unnamed protein product, partial [Ixodes hexagonus]